MWFSLFFKSKLSFLMILVCRYFFFPAFAVAVAFRKLPETNLGSIKIKKKFQGYDT